MGIIEDVMKALERIPIWKRVRGLPDEFDALRARVEALEKQLAGGGDVCPLCRKSAFKCVSSKKDRMFGEMGVMLDTYRCEACGHSEEQQRDTFKKK